jgi:hypothetical protein
MHPAMKLLASLVALLVGCGPAPRPEKMPPPQLGSSTAPGPSDPTVPPPDSDQMVPEKTTDKTTDKPMRTSMLDRQDDRADATDAGVGDALLPPGDGGTNPDALDTGSGAKLKGNPKPM